MNTYLSTPAGPAKVQFRATQPSWLVEVAEKHGLKWSRGSHDEYRWFFVAKDGGELGYKNTVKPFQSDVREHWERIGAWNVNRENSALQGVQLQQIMYRKEVLEVCYVDENLQNLPKRED